MNTIPEVIKQMASLDNLHQGEALYLRGAVLDIRPDSRGAAIRLASRPGKFETIQLSVKYQSLHAKCSCGISITGTLCPHAVAAAIAYSQTFSEKFDYCFNEEQLGIEGGETAWSALNPPEDNTRSALKEIKLPKMLRHFSRYKAQLFLYLSNIPDGVNPWHKLFIKADIHFDDKIFSGNNIRPVLDLENCAGGLTIEDFTPQDVALMRYLNSNADRKGHRFLMNTNILSGFMHCLTSFNRFYFNEINLKISPSPASLSLKVKQVAKGYEVTPGLKIGEQGVLKLHNSTLLTGLSGYWIGINYQFFWLPGIADVQWINEFLKGETIFLVENDFIALRQAVDDKLVPLSLTLEEGSELLEEECTPLMNLDWNNGVVQARIFFEYGSYISVKTSSETVWNGQNFALRNLDLEEETYIWLTENGFEQVNGSENTFYLDDFDAISRFLLNTLPELGQTWKLYFSENFSLCARHIKPIKMSVATKEENESWVTIAVDFQLDEEKINAWQQIINAVRNNRELVKLNDGRLFRIDQQTQKTLAALPQLETLQKGEYRFSRYMSVMINQLLTGYITEDSASWQKLEERLLNADNKPVKLNANLKTILRPYQKNGVAWLQAMKNTGFNAILADEMGLGKTIQALALLSADKKQNNSLPSLVICPTSLIENWLHECQKFTPELKAITLVGNSRNINQEELESYDLFITSYALIRRDVKHYAKLEFENLILDEAQNIKNHQSQTAQACKTLNAHFKLILSGTPVENSVKEIWSIFDFLLPGLLGTMNDFKGKYIQTNQENENPDGSVKLPRFDLATRIKPFILRRLKKDLLKQLPPKQEQVIFCELTEEQKSIYTAIAREAGTIQDADYNNKRFSVLALLLRLRQVCCHPNLLKAIKESQKQVESAKFELLKDLIYELKNSQSRALVFSQFTSMLKIVADWLNHEKIKFEYLDGSTQNRQEKVDRFNSDATIPIFLLSLKAGGTGLNLTGADTVIHYDMWWNPQVEDQATDRTHRIGQLNTVNVIKLVVKDTIEENILKLQQKKRTLFQNLMEGIPQKLGELTKDDLKFLLGDEF